MTIKDIEERSGLPRANIRYYETEGLLSPTRSPNGYRDYSEDDLATLMKVKLLRELGCSLEEISALQKEEAALSDVLERRLAALEGEALSLERAKDVCARLRLDHVTYATLDPTRYTPKDTPPLIPWEPIPSSIQVPPRYLWRRFFARGLDFFFAFVLVQLVRALVFDIGLFRQGAWNALLVSLLSLAVVLIAEPLMLHFWGTTPGKWAFRLRLVGEDGAPLGYKAALRRTRNVLLMGCGLNLPLVNLAAYGLAIYRELAYAPQPWERGDEVYEDTKPGKDFHAARSVGLCVLAAVLGAGLLIGGEWKAAHLPYPQPTTYQEFAANYNKIVRYTRSDTDSYPYVSLLPENTNELWCWEEDRNYHADSSCLSFQFADPAPSASSVLTTVSIDEERSAISRITFPGKEMAYALQALEGDSAFFLNPYSDLAKRCSYLQNGNREGLKRLPEKGWHAYLDYSAIGGALREASCGLEFVPQTRIKWDQDLYDWIRFPITQYVTLTLRLRRK